MNELKNKFLLAGDKLTPKMHLRQPQFTNTKAQRNRKFKIYLSKRTG